MKKRFGKKIKVIAFISVLALGVSVTFVDTRKAYAAVYEDCDQDGFDDYTGKALPWIFFDGTKGDEIPSDWDWNPAHTATSESAYYASRENKSNDSSSESGKSSSNTSSSESSSSTSKSSASSSESSSSTSKTSTSSGAKNSSGSSDSTSSVQGKTTQSSSSTAKKSSVKTTNKKTKKKSTNSRDHKTETVEETTTNKEETTAKEKIKKKKNKNSNQVEEKTITENEEKVSTTEVPEDILVGTIEVYEKDGSALHAGSEIVIKGDNFTAGLDGLNIEIHSNNEYKVGTYKIAEDGSFLAEYHLPKEIEEGEHEVVLTYNGENILVEKVQIGGKAISSFKDSLFVGFTSQNKELIPGIILLLSLLFLGVGAVLISTVRAKFKNDD